MKMLKNLVLLACLFVGSATLYPMAGEEAYYDPDLAGFTMVEVTNEPAAKAKLDADEAKRLIIKANKKLKEIDQFAKSEEVGQMIDMTNKMARGLRGLIFKSGPGFELSNKSMEPIWVSVVSNNRIITNPKSLGYARIDEGERLDSSLPNLKADMSFAIYLSNPGAVAYSAADGMFSVQPHYLYETTEGAQGRTKYLTWAPAKHNNPRKYLYPQTGRLGGLAKGSTSGYSLSNNIRSHELQVKD